jgi:hypothetical protein
MTRLITVISVIGVSLASGTATAQPSATAAVAAPPAPAPAPADEAPPTTGVWLSLPSIDGRTGAEIGFERFEPRWRISTVGTISARKTASGDYRSYAGGVGVEARWFWHGRAIWTPATSGTMVGPFLGGRLDAAISHTRNLADDRDLGSTVVLGWVGMIGYRIAPWHDITLTPSLGLDLRTERDLRGRLPPATRGSLALGLELGWMF